MYTASVLLTLYNTIQLVKSKHQCEIEFTQYYNTIINLLMQYIKPASLRS